MRQYLAIGSLSFGLALGSLTIARAEPLPQDVAKYRHYIMSAISGHIGAITLIVGGKVDDHQQLQSQADALAALANELPYLFPAGSAVGESKALPIIWEEPAKFHEAVEAGRTATANLQTAVKSGDKAEIQKSMRAVFQACKGCHDRYRKAEKPNS